MKKKKKKVIIVIASIVFLIIISGFLFVGVFPKMYLANKYDTKMSNYKVAEFVPGYFAYDINYWEITWQEMVIIYEYAPNSRQFEIDFFDFHYYDSYQMKDVEEWLIDELQKNIDKNIDFVNISSNSVYGIYDKEKEKYKNVVWTRDNIEQIIQGERFGEIFVKTNNIEKYVKTKSFSSTKHFNAYFDTNEKYTNYVNDILSNFLTSYNKKNDDLSSLSNCIILHENDLPSVLSYSTYEIDLYNLPEKTEKNIIMDD